MKKKHILFACTLAVGLAAATSASADPRTEVRHAVLQKSALDAKARGHRAPVALYLRGMGKQALDPMLEIVAGGPAAAGLPAEAVSAARRDLVEAIGLLRDPKATPVVSALLEKEGDEDLVRTAAEALARIGTDEAVARLRGALARSSGGRTTAILAGMGECRRESIAKLLADRLLAHPDEATARVLVRSLGSAGNAWAWRTMSSRSEESAVRSLAARALVDAYVTYGAEVRAAASNALMVVDDASTPALVAAARANASADTARALDALSARFATNPAR